MHLAPEAKKIHFQKTKIKIKPHISVDTLLRCSANPFPRQQQLLELSRGQPNSEMNQCSYCGSQWTNGTWHTDHKGPPCWVSRPLGVWNRHISQLLWQRSQQGRKDNTSSYRRPACPVATDVNGKLIIYLIKTFHTQILKILAAAKLTENYTVENIICHLR